ncbi:MAG: trypsin-like peptidase domain-containing protein [Acidobacteriota bacterium]
MTPAPPDHRSRRLALVAALALGTGLASTPASPPDLQSRILTARDRVLPALVHIEPILEVFRMGERGQMAVTGSGVIFSREGYVLTNDHVVENATRVTCTLSDQQEVQASLVGRDPLTDLAVLKLRGDGPWPHADLGDSDRIQAGQYVIAMGSPLGLARSISVGVISSLHRFIPEGQLPSGSTTGAFNTWIQTDAAINPGNSGGPLVSLEGRVIGINARAIPVFGENIGFAIPINLAREVSTALIEDGQVRRSWIGVNWQNLKSLTSFFGLGDDAEGVLVGSVVRGSPAEKAGLQAGDVVLEYDGQPVKVWFEEQLPRFQKRIADTPVGKKVPVHVLRDGEGLDLSITTQLRAKTGGDQKENREWGFTVREITAEMATAMDLSSRRGVMISGVRPGSYAFAGGLRSGDLVLQLDGVDVEDLTHWSQLYQQAIEEKRPEVLVTVRRGVATYFQVLTPQYDEQSATREETS